MVGLVLSGLSLCGMNLWTSTGPPATVYSLEIVQCVNMTIVEATG